ncbi:MAG TPA: hypothetical protein VG273_24085 [Bryobacteraceae bacterium]|jgi:hypothetical protein|nr:hypothetical protein [Bryobacteraceae bacterium]
MRDLSQIRAQVCERANIETLAVQAGFRRARGRGQYHCIHGADLHPSARIYQGRMVCHACGGRWSPIDLAMLVHGCDYVSALRLLAADTGVPWPSLTPAQSIHLRAQAPALAQDIADWAYAMRIKMEKQKTDLVRLLHRAYQRYDATRADAIEQAIADIPRWALVPNGDPRTIVQAYQQSLASDPVGTARLRDCGRADRQHAELVTDLVVQLLEAA